MKETMILLDEDQAMKVKGVYNNFYEIIPIKVVGGYALPIDIINDPEFLSIHEFLLTLPQQEVTFIEPEPIE